MPEGHILHHAARRIGSVLTGRTIERVEARGPHLRVARAEERLTGAQVTGVEARGKHLLIYTDRDITVHSHLRMDGAWHLYRVGEPWRKPTRRAWIAIESNGWVAVNFDGPILDLIAPGDLATHASLARLGPDILVQPFPDHRYLTNMRSVSHEEIGVAVMLQQVVSGIGNIYKCESLFMSGISPWDRVRDLPDSQLLALRATASRIMADGVLDQRAITYRGPGAPGKWVYGRTGRPCRRCGRPIRTADQGPEPRITWWCETCQQPTTGRNS